jgi:hypothetical protein
MFHSITEVCKKLYFLIYMHITHTTITITISKVININLSGDNVNNDLHKGVSVL